MMPAKLRDIAERAKTSVSTVSRVLNGKAGEYYIGSDIQERVLRAAEELRYKPNPLARGLRLKQTHTIGLVVPDIANPFFAHVTRSIQEEAHERGYSLIVCNSNDDPEMEAEHIDLLRQKRVDGMIVMPVGQRSAHLQEIAGAKLPIVLVDRTFNDFEADAVVMNNEKGGYLATDLLARQGHRRIGIIQGLEGTRTNDLRVQGYLKALSDHHIPEDPELVCGDDFREEAGYSAMQHLLRMPNRPTAVFTTSDVIALGALKAIIEEKLSIPDDISIVSFDDVDFAPVLVAPLTTVAQPRREMGKAAVQLLVRRIETKGEAEVEQVIFEPELKIRNSVRSLSGQTAGEG